MTAHEAVERMLDRVERVRNQPWDNRGDLEYVVGAIMIAAFEEFERDIRAAARR